MNPVLLLPRLHPADVEIALEQLESRGFSTDIRHVREENDAWYAASGGRVSPETSAEIAEEIRQIAHDCGFPSSDRQADRTRFDHHSTAYLAGEAPALDTGEAYRDDVWAFLSTVLLPDIVKWRFPTPAPERFHGGVRNTFQRLWIRGAVLDLGEASPARWSLVESLSEDAMVQIFERASLASKAPLARAIAQAWVDFSKHHPHGQMEEIMRIAIKLIRLRNRIINLSMLPQQDLIKAVRREFAMAALRIKELRASSP